MQSNNPVFRNSDEFNGKATNAYGNQVYGGAGTSYPGYGQAPTSDPSTWSVGTPGQAPGQAPADTRPMTIDSVVQRTGLALLVVLVGAFATWVLTPDLTTSDAQQHIGQISAWVLVGSGLAFVLSLANSFKKVISPALVLVFCLAEGVALGALSKLFDYQYGGGIVIQAVLGTFAAFAGTLAAYKFFEIKVGARFRMFVISAMFAMVGLGILEIILSMFGASIGLYGFSGIGLLFAIAGLVLGVFMLILDFDFVENGIRAGLPERESWRAAFGLTVSLVWIYVNLLRILAIMRR